MYNFKDYLANKDELINRMKAVKNQIIELENMEIDISEAVKKIDNAIDIIQTEKVSVVLVGAFSDGKTSVAAGWMNEKLSNMKISSDESSDEILCYIPNTIPDGCQIIDTPGLFGDKVGSDDNGGTIALSEITKKYISEANLILYVVTAKNPIKESHKECVSWILKDLNKKASTIFVINRMDDIADLTDEDDFQFQAKIKTENLQGKLLECGLSEEEAVGAKVACISAAPNGKGIEVWNSHREEYLKRSHLSNLEKMTNEILENSGKELITKTGCDILNNEIMKMIELLDYQEKQMIDVIIPERRECLKRNKKDLESLYKRLMRSRKDMKDALKALNKKKINAIRSSDIENFRDMMEDEIGILPDKEGYVLNSEINDIFQEFVDIYSGWSIDLGKKFQAEYDKQNEAIDGLLKKGANGVAIGLKGAGKLGAGTFKSGIFAGRELLGKMGVVIKFKPWQVTKMAAFATKALPVIGAGIDVVANIVENVMAQKRNKQFAESKDSIKEGINETFFEIIELLDSSESFVDEFAPQYKILEGQVKEDEDSITYQEELLKRYCKWRENILDIDINTL